jgi:hypothetical protein
MSGPWREVVHITATTGARGGRAWELELACHHIAVRWHPGGRRSRLAGFTARLRFAPRRVRCLLCSELEADFARR